MNTIKNGLGNRMKNSYEFRTRYLMPLKTFVIVRIDGKSFHTWTKRQHCNKPFDIKLVQIMQETTLQLCQNIQGCIFGYTQSDEINLILTDIQEENTNAWFNNNIQKIASVAASMTTAYFNSLYHGEEPALFDARTFVIPTIGEVKNYLVWRQKDATTNSITSLAQTYFTHKELNRKSSDEMQDMLHDKGVNWNELSTNLKRGSCIVRTRQLKDEQVKKVISTNIPQETIIDIKESKKSEKTRKESFKWSLLSDTPIFTKVFKEADTWLLNYIPLLYE